MAKKIFSIIENFLYSSRGYNTSIAGNGKGIEK
jgi:hypothetical protein